MNTEANKRIAELESELATELKRVSSYKTLVNSLEGQVSHYSKKDYSLSEARLNGLEQSLISEQEMNETLTDENLALQVHISTLRKAFNDYYLATRQRALTVDIEEKLLKLLKSTPAESLQAK